MQPKPFALQVDVGDLASFLPEGLQVTELHVGEDINGICRKAARRWLLAAIGLATVLVTGLATHF